MTFKCVIKIPVTKTVRRYGFFLRECRTPILYIGLTKYQSRKLYPKWTHSLGILSSNLHKLLRIKFMKNGTKCMLIITRFTTTKPFTPKTHNLLCEIKNLPFNIEDQQVLRPRVTTPLLFICLISDHLTRGLSNQISNILTKPKLSVGLIICPFQQENIPH